MLISAFFLARRPKKYLKITDMVFSYYILFALISRPPLGSFLETRLGVRPVFSFFGLIAGSTILALPFMVNPIKAGFPNLPRAALIYPSALFGFPFL